MLGMTNRFQMCFFFFCFFFFFFPFYFFLENLGCPEPFSGCPGRPDTRYVGPCRNVSKSMNTALSEN